VAGSVNGISLWDAMDVIKAYFVSTAHGRKALALRFSPYSEMLATVCHGYVGSEKMDDFFHR
jgi:hypothetical protein